MQPLKKLIISEFSTPRTLSFYEHMAVSGLWKSEEILIRKYFRKGPVLDIGCGTGRTTIALSKLGYKVTGIDITPAMIKSAQRIARRENIPIVYLVADACKLPFPARKFSNALFSFNGWSQIPGKKNRLSALKEAHRVLKKDGVFIFTTHIRSYKGKYLLTWGIEFFKHYIMKPFGYDPGYPDFGDLFFIRDSSSTYTRQYIHIASASEVERQINQAGFRLVYKGYRNNISSDDSGLKSSDCMFFVCKA
ncbi:MAG: class I SAM-dependent methyltransferase [Nanoarchaeota archaeon]|nr:class I SAM-dependent methyltransferase [Nanoarchaeota archaeon]